MSTASATSEPFLFQPGSPPPPGSPGSLPSRGNPSVQQARVEISQIVREVASAATQYTNRDEYLRFLADRVLRAVAAHGVVIYGGSSPHQVLCRLGEVTDLNLAPESHAAHARLLTEIASDQNPVVVPPMVGATDAEVPANPTEFPAAYTPIIIDAQTSSPYAIMEVFLPDLGSAASQRGCLRFVAQMADLAGEFLRGDRLRELTSELGTLQQLSRTIERMLQVGSTQQVETMWVDAIADQLNCDQVALCYIDGAISRIQAVSHVSRIDHHSDQASKIREVSLIELQADQDVFAAEGDGYWVASADRRTTLRLVGLNPVCSNSNRAARSRLVVGGHQAWLHAKRIQSIPGARLWQRLTGSTSVDPDASNQLTRRRRLGLTSAIVLTFVLMMALPVPVLLPASGVIRPLELDSYHAPDRSTVDVLHVRHGQTVRKGDVLLTLSSAEMDEKRTSLIGRRSVLMQQQSQWKQAIVVENNDANPSMQAYRGQEFEAELASIERRLEILAQQQQELTVRARRDGVVDAWRLRERLTSKPLERGEAVLSVIANDTTWVVDAVLPQKRVMRVEEAIEDKNISTKVSPKWSASDVVDATPLQFGPAVMDPVDGTNGVVLRLLLETPPVLGEQAQIEVPARIAIQCGHSPLGAVLTEDIRNWIATRLKMI